MAKDPKKRKRFFKDFKAELKKVIWPTPKQIVKNTIAVITIVLIIAGIVFVLDLTFDFLNTSGLNRIKERIETTDVTEEDVKGDASDVEDEEAEEEPEPESTETEDQE